MTPETAASSDSTTTVGAAVLAPRVTVTSPSPATEDETDPAADTAAPETVMDVPEALAAKVADASIKAAKAVANCALVVAELTTWLNSSPPRFTVYFKPACTLVTPIKSTTRVNRLASMALAEAAVWVAAVMKVPAVAWEMVRTSPLATAV